VPISEINPAVRYCSEIFPILSTVLDNFIGSLPIAERICRCFRNMILSYRWAMAPLLPTLAQKVLVSFEGSRNGCFLWVSTAIVREFSTGAENVEPETSRQVFSFLEQEITVMLRLLNEVAPSEIPDVIEDFFRLLTDAVLYYPSETLTSALAPSIFEATLAALTLQQFDPLMSTLHYLRDVLSFGSQNPSSSSDLESPDRVRAAVLAIVDARGELLIQRIIAGLLFHFPSDCIPDASGVLFDVVEIEPQKVVSWIGNTVKMLPSGTVSTQELDRLLSTIDKAVQAKEWKKVRWTMQGNYFLALGFLLEVPQIFDEYQLIKLDL
jgi:transportin-3